MVAITPDSPVAAVFGRSHAKRKLVEEGLGIRTVGELLFHLPRRYVVSTELSEVAEPVVGQLHVGRRRGVLVADDRSSTRGGKQQYRTEVRIRTNGPDFTLSFFSPYAGQAEKYVAEMRPGSRGLFTGKAKLFNGTWQLERAAPPDVRRGRRVRLPAAAAAGLPAHRTSSTCGTSSG